ncbi:MAG: HD domain-containing protein [Solobacterium sp.]|jgi:HD superfamily phosphohydrolase|nr:HD domain-containing protein [Solobacterium sp.]
MFPKTEEVKVMRDPVHGYIHVEYQVIWDVINSRWMQRLRRIHQLGGANMVYHTADHTRFSHSLGVYEIVRRMVSEVPDIDQALSEEEKVTVMLAGLLHDIGHGPYSHAFESISNRSHEAYTCDIITQDPEIRTILESCQKGLAEEVADVIRHKSANPLLPQLVSSQLDADRMDYLLRDAYFTGTKYGEFDIERVLRTLRVSDGKIVVKESGTYAAENYIMARYHMYWQVYYHPVARAYECGLLKLFLRLKDLMEEGKMPKTIPAFTPLLKQEKLSLDEYFALDECACNYGFELLCKAEDPIVRDLASRLLNRNLFEYQENNAAGNRKIRALLKQKGFDPRYYFGKDEARQRPYVPYSRTGSEGIWVRMHTGEILELSQASNIVNALVHGQERSDDRVFFPKEILENK